MRSPSLFRAAPLVAIVALAAFVTVTVWPSTTAAAVGLPHLKLTRAFPAADTTLTSSPDAVRLWFSESADLVATRISVAASNGVPVPVGKPARLPGRDMPITAAISTTLALGKYTVSWKTMSKDGHVVSGRYGFTLTSGR